MVRISSACVRRHNRRVRRKSPVWITHLLEVIPAGLGQTLIVDQGPSRSRLQNELEARLAMMVPNERIGRHDNDVHFTFKFKSPAGTELAAECDSAVQPASPLARRNAIPAALWRDQPSWPPQGRSIALRSSCDLRTMASSSRCLGAIALTGIATCGLRANVRSAGKTATTRWET